jgi:hypothetical protein
MTTKNDSKTASEVSSTDSEAKPRLSLRREKVKTLNGIRSAVRAGKPPHCGCYNESIEV